ncbi:hypothetical protein PAN31117_03048 [Pandoraea anapnoica]|uniref:ORC1/DEAH AAA+ ATPase domain-containing protein n=1 Tax=Pandoraea anapnoica TaxID=2508301 RepID=A0A5E5A6Q5_9BURK|nr:MULTISPECIES: ATP-binding protein [Pandoraea]VVE15279.1 hypothetical protein PIN31009_02843 [Pandoraea iniqua]VVE68747.1 hypothetical protein PAN31117_03048 [Pandoraea anapnoica]
MTEIATTDKPTVNRIAQTQNIALCDMALERALTRSDSLPALVCLYGPSGFGKSFAAAYVANKRRARYVAAKSSTTKTHFLKSVMHEMGIQHEGRLTVPDMVDVVSEELAASGRPLIVDEFDHMVSRNLVELVRDIYESSQMPILMIGEEGLPSKLKRWERMHGRVLAWVPAQPGSIEDARKLARIYCPKVAVGEDLLRRLVDVAHGSVRRICTNLENIQESGLQLGAETMTLASWGDREFYTGEAPKRRV